MRVRRDRPVGKNSSMRKGRPMQPPEMRCIFRHFNQDGEDGGWRVSIRRKYPAPAREYVKYFANAAHGGENAALVAAQSWRDEIVRRHPRTTKQDLAALMRKHNTSGTPGVYRKIMRKKARNGSVRRHILWQAQSPAGVIPFRSRSFAVAKFGEDEARRLAIEARKEFELLLAATPS